MNYFEAVDFKSIWYDWIGFNDWLFVAINSIRNPVYDDIMLKISFLGESRHFPYYFAAIFALLLLSLFRRLIAKHPIKWPYITSWLGVFVVLGVGFLVNVAAISVVKDHFSYPRPYVALASTGQVYKIETIEAEKDYKSFPSGHVAFVTFLVVALAPLMSKEMLRAGMFFIALMAWSRISLGMHFPADTLASVTITVPLIMIVRAIIYSAMNKIFKIKC